MGRSEIPAWCVPWSTNYLKVLGFIPGIYTDARILSCAVYPGALGYEGLDAKAVSDWGFGYVKLDGCNMPTGMEQDYKKVYRHWHDILSKMNKPMIFSESAPAYFAETENLTDWYSVMVWVPKFGQLTRFSRDILVSTVYWPEITGWNSIMFNYGQHIRLARYQKHRYFDGSDFLNADHFDLSLDEKKSHFAIWASVSAPLIISAYVSDLKKEEIEHLTNKNFIEANQESPALQPTLVIQDGTWDVLTKSLENGNRQAMNLNRGNFTGSHGISFARLGLPLAPVLRVNDLWAGEFKLALSEISTMNIPSHGTGVYRITSVVEGMKWDVTHTGMIFNTFSFRALTSSPHDIRWTNSTAVDRQI